MKKLLAVGVILLFLGLAIAPSINANIGKASIDRTQEKEITVLENIDSKELLFQTIIDIVNNPDIKQCLDQYNNKQFSSDFEYKDVFKPLLSKVSRFLFSTSFIKPSVTYDFLDSLYIKGTELATFFGKDEVLDITESGSIANQEVLDESINIINDEGIYNKISLLQKMNKDLTPDQSLWDFPIICTMLVTILLPVEGVMTLFFMIWGIIWVSGRFHNFPILSPIVDFMLALLAPVVLALYLIGYVLGCWWIP